MPDKNIYSAWRKSSRSNNQGGNCVEVGFTPDGAMTGIRDTKESGRPGQNTLEVSRSTWASFIGAIRRGDLAG